MGAIIIYGLLIVFFVGAGVLGYLLLKKKKEADAKSRKILELEINPPQKGVVDGMESVKKLHTKYVTEAKGSPSAFQELVIPAITEKWKGQQDFHSLMKCIKGDFEIAADQKDKHKDESLNVIWKAAAERVKENLKAKIKEEADKKTNFEEAKRFFVATADDPVIGHFNLSTFFMMEFGDLAYKQGNLKSTGGNNGHHQQSSEVIKT